jgi:hypothetical protein
VEYSSELATSIKARGNATSGAKKFTWLDHLLAILWISKRGKDRSEEFRGEMQKPELRGVSITKMIIITWMLT